MAELAIVGLVGLLGYTLSAPGKQPRVGGFEQPAPEHPQAYPFGPGTQVQEAMDADRRAAQAVWRDSLQPALTGVVTPGTKPDGTALPYFSSARAQATNNPLKQRRLELFTGAMDAGTSASGTWRKKAEVETMFRPQESAMPVRSGGSAGGVAVGADQARRYAAGLWRQNNILPAQQVRVGRGVGVDPGVPAADGFHPMLRVLPTNVGEYRKNNLPGGVVPGAAAVPSRPAEVTLAKQRPESFWTIERYPVGPGRAAATAPTNRAEEQLGCGKLVGSLYLGGGGADSSYVQPLHRARDGRDDDNPGEHKLNVTGARDGVGGYVNARDGGGRVDHQRREASAGGQAGVLTGPRAAAAKASYVVQDTHRAGTCAQVQGNPGSAVQGGQARPFDRAPRTLKEVVQGPVQPGVAAPYVKGARVQGTYKWLDRESKRYGQMTKDYMPAPGMASAASRRWSSVQCGDRVHVRDRSALATTATPAAMAPVGQPTGTYNRLPEQNARLDLGIAARQLAGNNLHVRIN